jgi:DNA-directed RNA polymerase sigma subunit (sigma70/sigma32)
VDVEDYLERAGCKDIDEFMARLAVYPEPRERRIIMSRIGLLPYLSYKELGENEDVSVERARQLFLIGLRRMRDFRKRATLPRHMP